jgi:hypothetical protein
MCPNRHPDLPIRYPRLSQFTGALPAPRQATLRPECSAASPLARRRRRLLAGANVRQKPRGSVVNQSRPLLPRLGIICVVRVWCLLGELGRVKRRYSTVAWSGRGMQVERQRFERAVSRTGSGTGARRSPGRNWMRSSIPDVNASAHQARVLPCFPVLVSDSTVHMPPRLLDPVIHAFAASTWYIRLQAPCVRRS